MLNVGLQAGILDARVFSMFVVMAVVLTFATTPLTLWVYPAKYHVRAGDTKGADGASIRTKSMYPPGPPAAIGESGMREKTTRFTVVLQKIEHLSAVMLLLQLLEPARATRSLPNLTAPLSLVSTLSNTDPSPEKKRPLSDVSSSNTPPKRSIALPAGSPGSNALTIDALRLVELTGRTYSVMESIETEMMAKKDSILQLFKQFGRLRGFNVNTAVSVVGQDSFPSSVAHHAAEAGAELVLIPWTTSGGGIVSEAMMEDAAAIPAGSSSAPTPFDSLFKTDNHGSPLYSAYIRQVFNESPCDVALFIDRGFGAADMNTGGGQHVFLPFFGGPDDRLALSLVYQLCCQESVTATVMRMETPGERVEGGQQERLRTISDASQDQDPAVEAHNSAMKNSQQTMVSLYMAGSTQAFR